MTAPRIAYKPAKIPERPLNYIKREERFISCLISLMSFK